MNSAAKACRFQFLGVMDYGQALNLQLRACEAIKRGACEDVLLLLEHPPAITLGRNGSWDHLLIPKAEAEMRGIRVYETDRGGDVTFHGPGQLVGYPVLRLEGRERDVHRYMRNLEEVLIRLLAAYGIDASRREGFAGAWTARGKIGAMGVHISRWVTRHGFSLNVAPEMSYFDLIVPCGIRGEAIASMCGILGRPLDIPEVAERLSAEFGRVMAREMVPDEGLKERLEREVTESAVA